MPPGVAGGLTAIGLGDLATRLRWTLVRLCCRPWSTPPRTWGKPLFRELEQAGAARDPSLATAARELMGLLDARDSQEGTFIVSVQYSQGVQEGDGNSQVNYFDGTRVKAGRDAYLAGRDLYVNSPRREQAEEVVLRMGCGRFPDYSLEDVAGFDVEPGLQVHMALVSNESRRPIRDVACRYGPHVAVMGGRLAGQQQGAPGKPPDLIRPVPLSSSVMVIRPGEKYGFAFELNFHRAPIGELGTARFTDDTDKHWQLDEHQHLKQLQERDW